MLFNSPEKALELYNATQETAYPLSFVSEVEIVTLKNVLFTTLKNDLAFVIGERLLMLTEHQSTISENIPLRMLMYIAREYEKITEGKNLYNKSLILLLTPQLIVLYNGKEPYPEEVELKLSDSYLHPIVGNAVEVIVRVININYRDGNQRVLQRSKTLREYSNFIQIIRDYESDGFNRDKAIQSAIADCIERNILTDFLKEHSSEVFNMLYTQFNINDALAVWKEEGRVEGREEGREEGLREGEKNTLRKIALSLLDTLDIDTISLKTGLSATEITELQQIQ